jgi:hypothetical protein
MEDIETEYIDPKTKEVVALKKARRQVSFFGAEGQPVAIDDGKALPETQWVDRRTKAKDDNAF